MADIIICQSEKVKLVVAAECILRDLQYACKHDFEIPVLNQVAEAVLNHLGSYVMNHLKDQEYFSAVPDGYPYKKDLEDAKEVLKMFQEQRRIYEVAIESQKDIYGHCPMDAYYIHEKLDNAVKALLMAFTRNDDDYDFMLNAARLQMHWAKVEKGKNESE